MKTEYSRAVSYIKNCIFTLNPKLTEDEYDSSKTFEQLGIDIFGRIRIIHLVEHYVELSISPTDRLMLMTPAAVIDFMCKDKL